jgi:hypothetical protein
MEPNIASDSAAPKLSLGGVLAKTVAPSAWVEYREGIFFHLRFVPKSRFRSLADDCTEHRYNAQTKVREPKLDSARFLSKFLKESVLGWRGVTLQSLSRIVEIDLSSYSEEELKQEIVFSVDELVKLFDMVYDIDQFVQSAVTDIKTFRPALEDELKNSKPSQNGS